MHHGSDDCVRNNLQHIDHPRGSFDCATVGHQQWQMALVYKYDIFFSSRSLL